VSAIDERATPKLAELREVFRSHYGFLKDAVDRIGSTFGPVWAADFDETLRTLFPSGDALELAARGYAKFVMNLLRAQRRFEKELAYPAKTYEEAAQEVYFDTEYMTSEYLPGLLLSHFLWPHHYHQLRFFENAFVSQMQLDDRPDFVEVGVGTGLFSRRTLQRVPEATGLAFDISPAAQAFAETHLRSFGFGDRWDVRLQDVTEGFDRTWPWLLCIEVLEHLEDPVAFLRALRAMLADGGRAFITAALDAAHVDHIYLYRTAQEVIVQLEEAGFALEQAFVGTAYKPAAPGLPVPTVAAFIVV
jgi:SAM-dependent methyltransferase